MTKPVAIITGASRGLGFALAENLSRTHHIIAVARTVGGLEDLDDAIKADGGEATLAPMDITDTNAMAHLCRSVHDRWGGAALWVHTAVHVTPLAPAHHMDQKDWRKTIATNLDAMGHLVPYIAALLGTSGKAIFFDDGFAGQKFFGAHGATKAGQLSLVASWQAETKSNGPDVRILHPRPMNTALHRRFFPGADVSSLATPMDEAKRLLPQILD